MTKLEQLRMIAESYAHTQQSPPTTLRGKRMIAEVFFIELARNMYPHNDNRYEWAHSNLLMFYDTVMEREEIMRKLRFKEELAR